MIKKLTIFCCIFLPITFFNVFGDSFGSDYVSVSDSELIVLDRYTRIINAKQEEILHFKELVEILKSTSGDVFDLSILIDEIRHIETILIPQSQADLEKLKEERSKFIKSFLPDNNSNIIFYNSLVQRMVSESEWRTRLLEQEIIDFDHRQMLE